jgi:1-acyl-sn-glycerol-3-phosphate acyltransferase
VAAVEESLMWALLKLYCGFLAIGLEMVVHLPLVPMFWLGRALGRDRQVDAVIDRMVIGWGRRCLAYLQCRVEVEGLEHLPPQAPVILMTNHQSLLDIPVCLGFLGRSMGFVAKRELFRIPFLSFWMRQIHCASMDRADVRSSGKLLADISRHVREGSYRFLIFPEGTRTRHPDGEIGPFKRGALRLADAEGLPIAPISLDGTRYMKLSILRRTPPRRRLVRVRVAPMVPVPKDLSAPESKKLMESLRQTIVSNWQIVRIDWERNESA